MWLWAVIVPHFPYLSKGDKYLSVFLGIKSIIISKVPGIIMMYLFLSVTTIIIASLCYLKFPQHFTNFQPLSPLWSHSIIRVPMWTDKEGSSSQLLWSWLFNWKIRGHLQVFFGSKKIISILQGRESRQRDVNSLAWGHRKLLLELGWKLRSPILICIRKIQW